MKNQGINLELILGINRRVSKVFLGGLIPCVINQNSGFSLGRFSIFGILAVCRASGEFPAPKHFYVEMIRCFNYSLIQEMISNSLFDSKFA